MQKINGCFATLIESLCKVIDMMYTKIKRCIVYINDEGHESIINLEPRLTENRDNEHLNQQIFSDLEFFTQN